MSKHNRFQPTLEGIKEATKRLEGITIKTPLIPLRWYDKNPNIWLKPENLQPIGSYKLRGVYNHVSKLSSEQRARGIATASTGNMAQAVGYVAKMYNIPAKVVVVGETVSEYKISLMKRYGVEIERVSINEVMEYIANPPFEHTFIHPLYEYGLTEGYGTITTEILEEAPDMDTIFVPVGAGLLSLGIAFARNLMNSGTKVVGVQTENSPHYYNSFKKGKLTPYRFHPTICDGIAWGQGDPDETQTGLIMEYLDDMMVVSEDKVMDAVKYLALENNLVTEGAGAIAVAAALELDESERGKSACILSGGSVPPEKLSKYVLL